MSIVGNSARRLGTAARLGWIGSAVLALSTTLVGGCPPPPVQEETPDGGTSTSCTDTEGSCLDPKVYFETEVKPQMASSCGICHQTKQDQVLPFLTPGDEYNSITSYGGGGFVSANPDESLLLKKGKHIGPALTDSQYAITRTWLSIEAAIRGKGMNSPTTPTVPIRLGEYNMNLESLVNDPLASISFTLELLTGRVYRIKNLTLNAGPVGGIHLKHPRLIVFSTTGAVPESNDAFSTVDMTVAASGKMTIGGGSLQLTSVPVSAARIAFAFEVVESVNPNPNIMLTCKNFAAFEPAVRTQLQPCAGTCHSNIAKDPRAGQALGAFDMSPILSGTMADYEKLCVRTLGRIVATDPNRSILVRQPAPYDPAATSDPYNGTPNHSYYKITDAAKFTAYKTAISTWAMGEK